MYTDDGKLMVRALRGQSSHMMGALRETNVFIKLAEDTTGFDRGDTVIVTPLMMDFS